MVDQATEQVGEGVEAGTPPTPNEAGTGVNEGDSPTPTEGVNEGDPPTPKPDGSQERIRDLVGQRKSRDNTITEQSAEITRLKEENAKNANQQVDVSRPKRDDYETDAAYETAYDDYQDARQDARADANNRERERTDEVKRVRTETEKLWEPFYALADKLDREKFPDMDKALTGEGVKYSPFSTDFVRTSKVGPQIAHHFVKNPDIAEKIGVMPIAEQSAALLNLQSEIVKSSVSNKTTGAPDPIVPGGDGGNIPAKDMNKVPMSEYAKSRNDSVNF